MSIDISRFRVGEGRAVNLEKWPTRVQELYGSKPEYRSALADQVKRLNERQDRLYAHRQHAVLVIFQALDAAGKDSAIKHVLSGINPQGVQVFSFKRPSDEELDHDFLWRTTRCLPERGRIGVFNRSYYEEVLVVRVHPEILAAQHLPDKAAGSPRLWQDRFESIVDFERHLHRNGTQVVKVFLHVSRDEQRKRLLARIDDPKKNWKFQAADLAERDRWKDYMRAYAECLEATSTDRAPWYVVPADDKPNAHLIVSQVILDTLNGLKLRDREPDRRKRKELQELRARLVE